MVKDQVAEMAKKILRKDERNLKVEGDNVVFYLNQEQVYTKEAAKNRIKSWRELKGKYEDFLKDFPKRKSDSIALMQKEMEKQLQNVKADYEKSDEQRLEEKKKELEDDKKRMKEFIDNYEAHVKDAINETKRQLDAMKEKAELELGYTKEGLDVWGKVEDEL